MDSGIPFQDEVWVDKNGVEHLIDDMTVTYCLNVMRFLENYFQEHSGRFLWGVFRETQGFLAPQGDMATLDVESGLEELCDAIHRDPVRWLKGTELYRALENRVNSMFRQDLFVGEWWNDEEHG